MLFPLLQARPASWPAPWRVSRSPSAAARYPPPPHCAQAARPAYRKAPAACPFLLPHAIAGYGSDTGPRGAAAPPARVRRQAGRTARRSPACTPGEGPPLRPVSPRTPRGGHQAILPHRARHVCNGQCHVSRRSRLALLTTEVYFILMSHGSLTERDRAARGEGRPETFAFLGFTHICATSKSGRFWIRRKTDSKRMRAKLMTVKDQFRRRRYLPHPRAGKMAGRVVRGHQAYYGVPGNYRRGSRLPHPGDTALAQGAAAPKPERLGSPGPDEPRRDPVATPSPHRAPIPGNALRRHAPKVRAQCGNPARWDLCGGPPARAVPTATPDDKRAA